MFQPEKERRRHHRFRFLFMDVTEFVRFYILRRQARKLVPGPRPAIHPPQSGPNWDPSLATGIERIDRDHQELMVALQSFEKAVKEGSGVRILNRVLKLMVRHSEDHFTLEESYMAHIKYPRLPSHREDHARQRARIRYLQQREGDPSKALELSAQLCKYLRDHILNEDASYAEFARNS